MSTADAPKVMSDALSLGERLLKADEVALYLGINRATVYRLAGQPFGIPVVEFGGNVRFRPSDVREYVESHIVNNHPRNRADRLLAAAHVAERPVDRRREVTLPARPQRRPTA